MERDGKVWCPECCGQMVLRVSRFGKFWGCTGYPHCRGIRQLGNPKAPTTRKSPTLNRAVKPTAHR